MLNVLVVEDDLMIADLLCEELAHDGYHVTGIARSVAEAKTASNGQHNDFAIIDLHLANGGIGTDVADDLRDINVFIGIVYSTGNDDLGLSKINGDAVMTKPYSMRDIGRALRIIDELAKIGVTKLPYPRNFKLLVNKL